MRKTDQEKAEIRRQTEARRQPDKDRSAHVAARPPGKGEASQNPFGKLVLDDHIEEILTELDAQSDRGAALIAASLVETHLMRAMITRFVGMKDVLNIVFHGERALFPTFSSRIRIARALGVIGPVSESHLNAIRRIRNDFAHSMRKIDFKHPSIAFECAKLLPHAPEWKPELNPERSRYLATVIVLSLALEGYLVKNTDSTMPPGALD